MVSLYIFCEGGWIETVHVVAPFAAFLYYTYVGIEQVRYGP